MKTLTSHFSFVPSLPSSLRVSKIMMAVVTAVIVALSALALMYVVHKDFERDLEQWQVRVGLFADVRADAILNWVDEQQETVVELARNTSLQLYVTELHHAQNASPEYAHQRIYLQNLLSAEAKRGAFHGTSGMAGIALFFSEEEPLVASSEFPRALPELQLFLQHFRAGGAAISPFISVDVDGKKEALLAFAAPVFPIQSDEDSASPIAVIVGVVSAQEYLFPLLSLPALSESFMETFLVSSSVEKGVLRYLSPLRGSLESVELGGTVDRASLFAIMSARRFSVEEDYAARKVLVTGREIGELPWILVQTAEYDEAFRNTLRRQYALYGAGCAVVLAVSALLWGVWWYGTSARYKQLAQHYSAQHALTRLIAEHKPDPLYVVGEDATCFFANREAWRRTGRTAILKPLPLSELVESERLEVYRRANEQALREKRVISYLYQDVVATADEGARVQIRHVPLAKIPSLYSAGKEGAGVLILEHDVSDVMRGKERLAGTLHALVGTLVSLMDQRDHHAVGHSVRVASIARSVAERLGCSKQDLETIEIAARLMNLGKILVSRRVLTKIQALTKEEEALLHDSLHQSAALIEGVAFDGPVQDTILQARENVDGSGPLGLRGDRILLSARIIRVANDFVSMTSSRAYRAALSAERALEECGRYADISYERDVLVALAAVVGASG